MADYKDVVRLAVDAYNGRTTKYSTEESMDVLRQALIEANGGSTTLDYRAIRDGKCNGLFAIVEEILASTVVSGFTGDEWFNKLVEFRNVALGDKNEFVVKDSNLFMVAEAADGTQGVRRQRLSGANVVSIPTTLKVVRIYEELSRVLSGQVDLNEMINKVGESFKKAILDEIFAMWSAATATDFGGANYYNAGGNYDEDTLLDIIAHVEAAAGGKPATIIGTKKVLRNLVPAYQGVDSQNDLYHMGYYGSFYGTPVIATPQVYKTGTTSFAYSDKVITVVAGDEKPIKCVYEGDPIAYMKDPLSNRDNTYEYFYADKWGTGIVLAGGNAGIGRYEIL